MKYSNEYFTYEIPEGWITEEGDGCFSLYNPSGKGALTLSYYYFTEDFTSDLNSIGALDSQISVMAKQFSEDNEIVMDNPFIMYSKDDKRIIYGTGKTLDNWFIKIWIAADYTQMILASYESKKNNKETKICDSVIDSISFVNNMQNF